MKKKDKNRRQLNNMGMSLVEVLVAITILAIVTGPLLKTFVTATIFNARAKERQQLTTAAQSVMEGFKAYDVEELCKQFANLSTFGVVANATGHTEIPLSDKDGDGVADTGIMTVTEGGITTQKFVPATDGKYAFALAGMNYEGSLYDAKVELSPLVTSDIVVVNETVIIEPFDANTDAQYDQDANQDAAALAAIKEYAKVKDYTLANSANWNSWWGIDAATIESTVNSIVDSSLHLAKKTTYIVVGTEWSNAFGMNINVVRVYSAYEYTMDAYSEVIGTDPYGGDIVVQSNAQGPFTVYIAEDGTATENAYYADKTQIYPSDTAPSVTTDATQIKNIQFCYYPAYEYNQLGSEKINSIPQESIVIENNTDKILNISLIKQTNASLTTAQLTTLENVYNSMIASNVSISGTGADKVTKTDNFSVNLADAASGGSLLAKKSEVLMYDVKITLYKNGAAAANFSAAWEPLLELSGTMND